MKSNPLGILSIFVGGSLSVEIDGKPLFKLDAEKRSVDLEVQGVVETGLKLSKLKTSQDKRLGLLGLLKTSRETAKDLSDVGWKMSLSDKDSTVLTMGSGVSRLSGRIRANPLKLRRVAKIL
jgi:hypothetical protein